MSKLLEVIKDSGLNEAQTKDLMEHFEEFQRVADAWEEKAKEIVVTDGSQTDMIIRAKNARMFIKTKRIALEKTRKTLKERSLKEGQAIDKIANTLKALIEPIEKHLTQQENFVEIQEGKRKRELFEERREICRKHNVNYDFLNLREMPEEDFQRIVTSKIDADRQAEEDCIEQERFAKEKIEREEKERQQILKQNEKLRAEKKKADEKIKVAQAKAREEEEKRLNAEADAAREKKAKDNALRREKTAKDAKTKVKVETIARMASTEEMLIIARKALTHVHQGTGSECKWCSGNRIIIERIIGQIGGFLE